MTGAFAFRTALVSHVGLARRLNEDSVLARPEIGLWAVADGMGGHGGGGVASRAVVEALKSLTPQASAPELLGAFERCLIRVNAQLLALARSRGATVMGTTLVALLVHGTHFACVWCGDSRVYLLREGKLSQVSRDHSEVQELVEKGVIDKDEARIWPRRNVVTRALGAADQAQLEIVDGPASAGDRFLLCSDGLTTHLADREIAALLATGDPRRACDDLLAETLQRGASDNVSLIVVDLEASASALEARLQALARDVEA